MAAVSGRSAEESTRHESDQKATSKDTSCIAQQKIASCVFMAPALPLALAYWIPIRTGVTSEQEEDREVATKVAMPGPSRLKVVRADNLEANQGDALLQGLSPIDDFGDVGLPLLLPDPSSCVAAAARCRLPESEDCQFL